MKRYILLKCCYCGNYCVVEGDTYKRLLTNDVICSECLPSGFDVVENLIPDSVIEMGECESVDEYVERIGLFGEMKMHPNEFDAHELKAEFSKHGIDIDLSL